MSEKIPFHNFTKDDNTSIAFRLEQLNYKNKYNTDVPHRHNYYEIFLFENGGGTHIIDFETHEIIGHSIHFISPGQIHQVNRELNSNGFVIMFSRDFTHSGILNKDLLYQLPFFHNFTKDPTIEFDKEQFEVIHGIFKSIDKEYHSNLLSNVDILQSYLNILLLKCKQYYKNEIGFGTKEHHMVQKFIRTLEMEFNEVHQVQVYADYLEISPDQLNDLTKKFLGRTASEIIKERLILESKRLLVYTAQSAKEIAYQLNFNDPAHFSNFFKSKTGLTPNEFKSQGAKKYR